MECGAETPQKFAQEGAKVMICDETRSGRQWWQTCSGRRMKHCLFKKRFDDCQQVSSTGRKQGFRIWCVEYSGSQRCVLWQLVRITRGSSIETGHETMNSPETVFIFFCLVFHAFLTKKGGSFVIKRVDFQAKGYPITPAYCAQKGHDCLLRNSAPSTTLPEGAANCICPAPFDTPLLP